MSGLDYLSADYIGAFDYMSLLKGAGGLLSGFGGGGGGGDDKGAAERARLEEQRRQAEKSASNMRMALIGVAAVSVAGLAVLLARR
jgi:hypothetical protein